MRILGGHHCCYFPFIFNGELQTACLKTPRPRGDFSRKAAWCSMKYDFDNEPIWKYCMGTYYVAKVIATVTVTVIVIVIEIETIYLKS